MQTILSVSITGVRAADPLKYAMKNVSATKFPFSLCCAVLCLPGTQINMDDSDTCTEKMSIKKNCQFSTQIKQIKKKQAYKS